MIYDLDRVVSLHSGNQAKYVNGRNVAAGNFRGNGLEFGKLREFVEADPLYQAAYQLAKGFSICMPVKLMNLFIILKYGFQPDTEGSIVEFGSFKGGSAMFMARVVKELHPSMKVYALDTFEGMPHADPVLDMVSKGQFSNTSLAELEDAIKKHDLLNLIPVKGLFNETFPGLYPPPPTHKRDAGKRAESTLRCRSSTSYCPSTY